MADKEKSSGGDSPGTSGSQVSAVFNAVDQVFQNVDMAWGNYWDAETFKVKMDMWNKEFSEKVRQFNTSTGIERQRIGIELDKMKNSMKQFKLEFDETKRQFGEKMALEWANQKLNEWKAQQDVGLEKERIGIEKERTGIQREQLGLEKQMGTSKMRGEALERQKSQYDFGQRLQADKTQGAFGRALAYGVALGMKGGKAPAAMPGQPAAPQFQAPATAPAQAGIQTPGGV